MKKYSFLIIAFLFSCAVKSLPSGGPQDLEPPYIKNIKPLEGSVNIKLNQSIEIEFNEMLDPNSVKSSISLIPSIDIKINSYGNKIIVKPEDKWPENSEFKIKVDRNISDYKGNKIKESKLLSFSTSSSISNGYNRGKLFNVDTLKVATVGLYININDSLYNYASIQSDSNNEFEFKNIKNGKYIITALVNPVNNIHNDINLYPYGLYSKEVIIDNNIVDNINLYISNSNKREKIVSVDIFNDFYGEVELTNSTKIPLISYSIGQDFGDINDYYQFDILSDSIYLSINMSNNIDSYKILGNYKLNKSLNDSIGPEVVDAYFAEGKYMLEFSEPVKIKSKPFIGLGEEQDSTILSYSYKTPKLIYVDGVTDKHKMIVFDEYLITDFSKNENILSDGMLSIKKNQIDETGTGDISGNVLYSGKHDIIVEMLDVKSGESNQVLVDKNGNFVFENVIANKYKIWAYEDINVYSKKYFNGTLNPLKLAADFGLYNDIVEVRKNWDIEGIEIKINGYK